MAIAKIVYKESANATPVTWMDTTQKTVTAGSMLNGITALKNDGTDVTGNIASKSSSDLTANNLTVTAPAGYYASAASKTLSDQNLVAGNVKKDVTIFGTTGTYEGSGGNTYTRTVIAPLQTVTPDSNRRAVLSNVSGVVEDGEQYIITVDGEEWISTCQVLWSSNYCLGEVQWYFGNNFDSVFPFGSIYYQGEMECAFPNTSQHTVKVEHLVLT